MSNLSSPGILLSATQNFQNHDALPLDDVHSFSSSAETICSTLQDLINTTDHLGNSLNLYSSATFSNPKLISLLRQHTSIAHTLHQSARNTHQIVDALRKKSRLSYGEDIPLDASAIVEWCISRLEAWGIGVGMETFKDEGREGAITVVLGGKVLVVDVDLAVDRRDPSNPSISVSSVKTSYATGTPSNGGSAALDSFLQKTIDRFCAEIQLSVEVRDLREAARLGLNISEQLQYLVMLDKLADRKEGGGLKWFAAVDELSPLLINFAKKEADAVAIPLHGPTVPLDIFLSRSHGLPLPYLLSPSISFLVHISPISYLNLLQARAISKPEQNDTGAPNLDIPPSVIRSYLHSCPTGAIVATLLLSSMSASHIFPVSMAMPNFTSRPTFPLDPHGPELEYTFLQAADIANPMASYDSEGRYTWFLDFTNGGKTSGVVMSQPRMREIELIVNPLGGIDAFSTVGMMSFGSKSWVNLLLEPQNNTSPERYTTLYISPNSLHPPLHLRLTVPEEPGFRLERVPVHNMKEVWGILEVVREQCWLNGIITGCEWIPEGLSQKTHDVVEEREATREELQAVLTGNITPTKIPVNIFLPPPPSAFSDLDSMSIPQINQRGSKIVMTSPERAPISGLVQITVTYDETRPRGVSVKVSGAMGADIKPETLEEISRRGGTLGLSGRVWSKAHGSM